MLRRSTERSLHELATLVLLAIVYFVVAKGGLALASIHPSASPVWPPSGVALAALVLGGSRLWPSICVGAFLANVSTFGSTFTSFAIAGGNTLEAVITVWLLAKWSGGATTFDTPRQVAKFALVCLVSGTLVSATAGVGSLSVAGYADPTRFGPIWITWWLGDTCGQLLVAPAIILWAQADWRSLDKSTLLSWILLVLVTAGVGLLAFGPVFDETARRVPLAFLVVVPLLWAALRHGQRGTATAALVLSGFAIWGTLEHSGPWSGATVNDSFILVLTFVISAVIPSLILSADVAVRRHAEEDARRLASIVESSDDAILATDLVGTITSWNRGAERLYGHSADEMLGKSASLLIPPDHRDEEESILQRIRRGEHVDHFETVRRRSDGGLVNVWLSVSPLKNADGKIVGASKIARDITDRKRAEDRQKLLLGEMKHRIKNSLAILQSVANQTLGSASPEDRAAFVARLHALARTHDLLTLETWNQASLRDVVGKALEPFEDTQRSRFLIDGPELRFGASQALMLSMALHELATNAGKYGALSNDSGRVEIAWKLRQEGDDTRLNFTWQEIGGPDVQAPSRKRFRLDADRARSDKRGWALEFGVLAGGSSLELGYVN